MKKPEPAGPQCAKPGAGDCSRVQCARRRPVAQVADGSAPFINAGGTYRRPPSKPSSEPAPATGDLHIGVSVEQYGATIAILQGHTDGTATMIYTGRHPTGDTIGYATIAAAPADDQKGGA